VVPALPERPHREKPGELPSEEVDEAVVASGATVSRVIMRPQWLPVLAPF
jgi:hypothetical protein